jgi:glycosyltransferase involved in cell wall biosynthesis
VSSRHRDEERALFSTATTLNGVFDRIQPHRSNGIRATSRTAPIRVLHLAGQLETGGTERLLVDFARHTNREATDLVFVALSTGGTPAEDIRACGWPVLTLEKPPGFRPKAIFRLARILRLRRVDILHVHNTGPFIYGSLAACIAGIKHIIFTRHGRETDVKRSHLTLSRLLSRLADRIVCVSDDSSQLASQQGWPRKKISTIWNGIDLSRFRYVGPKPDGPVTMVARLSPVKDTRTLLEATAVVARSYSNLQVAIAGDGPCFADLKAASLELGLGEHVRFLGEVKAVPELLGQASMLVLPSLSEGLPLTVLEAMACGLPIVATHVGGTPEAVRDGETGFLVPPRSPAQLAEKILQVLRHPEEAKTMGLAGRRRVEQFFSIQSMIDSYEGLYREVTGRHRT